MSIDARNLRLILGRRAAQSALSLVVSEVINEVPTYTVDYISDDASLTGLLGEKAEIVLPDIENQLGIASRRFCGLVTAAEMSGDDRSVTAFGRQVRLTVRPFLALLEYSSRCHVHQNKSSVEILSDILELNGLKHSPIRIGASPPRREICIQYNEDDLSFVTRLLAEDGVAFYFGDGSAADVLVLHDSARPFPGGGVPIALTDASMPNVGRLRADGLSRTSRAATGKVALTSYDVARAAQNASGPDPVGDTPGMTTTAETRHLPIVSGDLKADERRRRAAERRGAAQEISGQCDHPAAYLGQAMTITSTSDDIAGDYVVSRLAYRSGDDGRVHLSFAASPRGTGPVPRRPQKPMMPGLHNAVVVGGDPGTAVQDAQGRVKVRFVWDSTGDARDTSCWLRVATPLAGNGYGALFTPRAGHEVLVGFLNGDPDVPVIVGALYNGKNAHPYMAAGATRSGVTSKVTQALANELEFDDKPGAEKLCLRAAKDMDVTVTDAATTTIGTTETRQIGKAAKHGYGATWDVEVADDATCKASSITLEAKSRLVLKVGSSQIEMTTSGITIKAAQVKIDASSLDAKGSGQFKLSGGSGSIAASGPLNLKGLQLTAEGSAMATLKAGGMLTVQGSGMATIKGGIVQIN
jgi:type VI secretion system secreted protein VgrG